MFLIKNNLPVQIPIHVNIILLTKSFSSVQPLNQVHANHLCAVIGQALNTLDGSCEAIDSYSQAIHTLCNIHDLHHAQLVMSYCKKIEAETSLRPSSLVHLLLAKSHLYLELSQVG